MATIPRSEIVDRGRYVALKLFGEITERLNTVPPAVRAVALSELILGLQEHQFQQELQQGGLGRAYKAAWRGVLHSLEMTRP